MSAVPLRPLGVGEILDVGLKIAWRNAGTLIRVVVIVVLPIQILTTLIVIAATPDSFEYNGDFGSMTAKSGVDVSGADVAAVTTGITVALLLAVVGFLLATGACYRAIVSAYLGEPIGWRESLDYAVRRASSLLWISILGFVIVGVGLVLCIVPGIYLAVCFAVVVPVLMTEGTRGSAALGRS